MKVFEEKGTKGGTRWMVNYRKTIKNEDAHQLVCMHTSNAHIHVYMHKHNCTYLPQDQTSISVNENYITRTPTHQVFGTCGRSRKLSWKSWEIS